MKFQFTCPSRSTTCRHCCRATNSLSFQFTCPSRSTTRIAFAVRESLLFQFTCPSRSTTRSVKYTGKHVMVSIHVPLAEHDRACQGQAHLHFGFNSRAPRGARQHMAERKAKKPVFQFTCPSRSTTSGGRDISADFFVSIHVSLAEHDSG